MIKIEKGNLLSLARLGRFHAIAHGVNCHGIMGAGIALQIAEQFPSVNNQYKSLCQTTSIRQSLLGTVQIVQGSTLVTAEEKSFIVCNLFTQIRPGPDARYSAIENCLTHLKYKIRPKVEIGFPWIGCGIGGLNQNLVKDIFDKVFAKSDLSITIIEYQP